MSVRVGSLLGGTRQGGFNVSSEVPAQSRLPRRRAQTQTELDAGRGGRVFVSASQYVAFTYYYVRAVWAFWVEPVFCLAGLGGIRRRARSSQQISEVEMIGGVSRGTPRKACREVWSFYTARWARGRNAELAPLELGLGACFPVLPLWTHIPARPGMSQARGWPHEPRG